GRTHLQRRSAARPDRRAAPPLDRTRCTRGRCARSRPRALPPARPRGLRLRPLPLQRADPPAGQLRTSRGMREVVDAARLHAFMRALGRESRAESRVYLTGGSSAVLLDWRSSTIDVDVKIEPERDELFHAIVSIKDALHVNVELASRGDFIPHLPGWRERSPCIAKEGHVFFHHYDFYAQALSKIERGHGRDLNDVRAMHERGLVTAPNLLARFAEIEPLLFRYPAIDAASFRAKVVAAA